MKIIVSHPTSNQFNRTALNGMLEAEMLQEFHTSIANFPGTNMDRVAGLGPMKILRRRQFDTSLRSYTRTWPWKEAGRILAPKMGLSGAVKHETGAFCLDAVYKKQDQLVARRIDKLAPKGLAGVYAYEDGALESFKEAHRRGISCLYDLPIGYWRTARKLMESELERWPDWAATLTGFKDSAEKLERKDAELSLADCVFVASSFTARSLINYPGELPQVSIIPYGFPKVYEQRTYRESKGRPIKLLFVGGLSQRKGIADLFWAVNQLKNHVSLTVIGRRPEVPCQVLDNALKDHTWYPSLPHKEVLRQMREHDVLVFPSLFEGFGMVISEAMSQGTPVITTDRTAGGDFIKHGENGWLVKAGSKQSLLSAIEEIIIDPDSIARVGAMAMELARQRPWEQYGRELAQAVKRAMLIKKGSENFY